MASEVRARGARRLRQEPDNRETALGRRAELKDQAAKLSAPVSTPISTPVGHGQRPQWHHTRTLGVRACIAYELIASALQRLDRGWV